MDLTVGQKGYVWNSINGFDSKMDGYKQSSVSENDTGSMSDYLEML